MQNIDGTLYKTNKIYRDIVDEMIAAENKRMKIQAEFKRQSALRQAEEARRRAKMNALRGRLRSYANKYITPGCQAQWRSYLSTSAGKLPAICAHIPSSRRRLVDQSFWLQALLPTSSNGNLQLHRSFLMVSV